MDGTRMRGRTERMQGNGEGLICKGWNMKKRKCGEVKERNKAEEEKIRERGRLSKGEWLKQIR